jgi:hypothetical protein
MLREGRISPALANAALERHNAGGERFEEALIECGLPESMLLRHLAEMFSTKFISTKTLQGAAVPRAALHRLSQRLAERYQVVPLRFAEDETLTMVVGDLSSPDLLENVRVAAGARQVKGLVARPSAVQAAISKFYRGDAGAFDRIGRQEDGDGSWMRTSRAGAAPRSATPRAWPNVLWCCTSARAARSRVTRCASRA